MSNLSSAETDVEQLIDSHPMSARQWTIALLTFLIVVADGMDLSLVSHLFPRLMTEWGSSIGHVTFTVTAGTVAMAIGAVVSGPAANRWGRKPVLLSGFALFCVATACLGLSTSIEPFIALRLVACIGLGIVMPSRSRRLRIGALVSVAVRSLLWYSPVPRSAAYSGPTLPQPSSLRSGGRRWRCSSG